MKYQVGQIYMRKNIGIFGRVVDYYNLKMFKRSDVTHVGIIAEVKEDQVLIYEALPDGFVSNWYEISWLESQREKGKVYIAKTNEKLKNVKKNCEKYQNIKYSWINIFFHAINLINPFKQIKYTDGDKYLHCSEAVSRVIYDSSNKVNFAEEYLKPFDMVSPQEIFMSFQIKII